MVGSAVATMVWSRAARAMPSMRAPRITRIRRCSALAASSSTGAIASSVTSFVQVLLEVLRETTEQVGQGGQVVVVPILQEQFEPGPAPPPPPFDGPPTVRREANPRSTAVEGVGLAHDHPVPLELLDLAGHRRGVETQYLGEVGDSQRGAFRRELEKKGGSGAVEPDPGQAQEAFMQAHLGDRSGDGLQRLVEPVDVEGRRARVTVRGDSCFQHVNIVAAPFGEVAAAPWRSLPRVPTPTPVLRGAGLDRNRSPL